MTGTRAADPAPFDAKLLDAVAARPIGPANMSGRICDVAVVESKPSTMYVAAATGGVWKTINNGTTWTPVFDQQDVASIGAIAVAPSDPNILFVGTGEANPRNSVSWGNGVYLSSDAGKSWSHLGLRETHHIGRVVIHPKNPAVVYVAALGHLWGANKERGLYKTADGGKTWQQALFVNSDTGCIDVALDPADPDTVYAATWQVRRDAFSGGNPVVQTGPGSGLHKSADGGKTWTRMSAGLPDRPLGRCGLAVSRKDPHLVYAVIQTDKTTSTTQGQAAGESTDASTGGVFRSEDKGQTWKKLNDLCPRPFYYGQIRIDPDEPQRIYVLGVALHVSTDGGRTFRRDSLPDLHPDHHALWIDPRDSQHLVLGNDGGLYFSYDQGASWQHLKNLPLGQFYGIAVDQRKPYRVYGGLQDNGTWGGPSATCNLEGITLGDWFKILSSDGFQCQVDPMDPDIVYAESQYGRPQRLNVRTGAKTTIRPVAERFQPDYRFNWCAPMLLSTHNPRMLYYGGNHLFRSANRGDKWEVISPDLTRGKPGASADFGHTLTTIAESPLRAGVLYVGSDDGRLQVTRNGGSDWLDRSDKVPALPPNRWITRLEPSHFFEGTAYLAISRYRNDDRAPYLFKTNDYGSTWQPLANDLPSGAPIHVVREDPRNPDLLFAGTEFGLFASLDAGRHWQRLRNGLTPAPVHDLVIHPRDRELVIGTHGRSLYVLDILPLEELTPRVLDYNAFLFPVKSATAFEHRRPRNLTGGGQFAAPNPAYGATIYYYLKAAAPNAIRISITDSAGKKVAELRGPGEPGIQQVTWDLRQAASKLTLSPAPPSLVPPGEYMARLKFGDKELTRKFRVEAEE